MSHATAATVAGVVLLLLAVLVAGVVALEAVNAALAWVLGWDR